MLHKMSIDDLYKQTKELLNSEYENFEFIDNGQPNTIVISTTNKETNGKYIVKSTCDNEKQNEYIILKKLSNLHPNIISLEQRIVSGLPVGESTRMSGLPAGESTRISNDYTLYLFRQQSNYKNLTKILFDNVSLNDKLHIASQICDTIKFLHENNVLHLDIKHKNILVDDQYNILLVDFGNSLLIDSNKEKDPATRKYFDENTESIDINYTPNFASPELCKHVINKTYNRTIFCEIFNIFADIYCLGVTLYYIFSNNRQPFIPSHSVNNADMRIQLYKKIINKLPDDFECEDDTIKEFIFKMMNKNPVERPIIQEVAEFFNKI